MQTALSEMATICRHFDPTKTTLTSRVCQLTDQSGLRCWVCCSNFRRMCAAVFSVNRHCQNLFRLFLRRGLWRGKVRLHLNLLSWREDCITTQIEAIPCDDVTFKNGVWVQMKNETDWSVTRTRCCKFRQGGAESRPPISTVYIFCASCWMFALTDWNSLYLQRPRLFKKLFSHSRIRFREAGSASRVKMTCGTNSKGS